jgi:Concanavalin A-like lectin/glucanases superfamily
MCSNRKREWTSRWLWIALGSSWLVACSDDSSGKVDTAAAQQLPSGAAMDAGNEAMSGDDEAASGTMSEGEGQPNASLDPGAGASSSGEAVDPCTLDRDFDGTDDCTDECPSNFSKTAPGICGCAVADSDVDFDGAIDCQDQCPLDPGKAEPGLCGCGFADADTDLDGAVDCQEACPFDAEKTEAGACGCGAPDDLPLCLRHRYSFDGEGLTLVDLVGDADGTLINTTLAGTGNLAIEGGASEQYVVLPGGIISALGPSATIEAWVSWTGLGGSWQRIFDFGSSDAGPGLQGNGATYFFLTPSNGTDLTLRTAMTNAGLASETFIGAAAPLPFPERVHVAVVVDGRAQTLSLYLQGVFLGTQATGAITLARLNDIDNYIGRSQWTFDEEYQGVYDEFRIYSAALTRQQLGASIAAGPDELPEPIVVAPAPGEGGPDAGGTEEPPTDTP